jgi:hypothetical protein
MAIQNHTLTEFARHELHIFLKFTLIESDLPLPEDDALLSANFEAAVSTKSQVRRPVVSFMTTDCFRYSPPLTVSIRKNDLLHGDRIATEFKLWGVRTHPTVIYLYFVEKVRI